jgi:hypothetical protein
LLLVSLFLIIAAPRSVATAQQPGPAHKVQGAVRVVDVRGRALEVTTGVGMALRVVRLQVPAPLSLTGLRPGDVVRVSYGARPGGYVAYTIERLERAP